MFWQPRRCDVETIMACVVAAAFALLVAQQFGGDP